MGDLSSAKPHLTADEPRRRPALHSERQEAEHAAGGQRRMARSKMTTAVCGWLCNGLAVMNESGRAKADERRMQGVCSSHRNPAWILHFISVRPRLSRGSARPTLYGSERWPGLAPRTGLKKQCKASRLIVRCIAAGFDTTAGKLSPCYSYET